MNWILVHSYSFFKECYLCSLTPIHSDRVCVFSPWVFCVSLDVFACILLAMMVKWKQNSISSRNFFHVSVRWILRLFVDTPNFCWLPRKYWLMGLQSCTTFSLWKFQYLLLLNLQWIHTKEVFHQSWKQIKTTNVATVLQALSLKIF